MLRTIAGLGTAMAVLAAGQAFASGPQCGEHEAIIQALARTYMEAPKAVGFAGGGRVIEVFVSAEGTWTILVTDASGRTCVLAAGQDWENVPFDLANLEPEA